MFSRVRVGLNIFYSSQELELCIVQTLIHLPVTHNAPECCIHSRRVHADFVVDVLG